VKSKKVGTDEGKPYLHPQNSVELVVVLVSKEREREGKSCNGSSLNEFNRSKHIDGTDCYSQQVCFIKRAGSP
jgi:hypothetical protein